MKNIRKNKPEVQEFTSDFLNKNGRCGLSHKNSTHQNNRKYQELHEFKRL